jgi:hypothetical protein
VGLSVFAAVPDCLFLYVDFTSDDIYVLQCSGRFEQILELKGHKRLVLGETTAWADIPRISWQDLLCVSIPKPRKLSSDEIALQEGLVVNIEHLLAGQIKDETTIDGIFAHNENVRAIMLVAQTRNRTQDFQTWLQPYLDPSKPTVVTPVDDGGVSMKAMMAILEEVQTSPSPVRQKELQQQLHRERASSIATYQDSYRRSSEAQTHRRRVSSVANERSSSKSTSADALNPFNEENSSDDDTMPSIDGKVDSPMRPSPRAAKTVQPVHMTPLYIQPFVKSKDGDTFEGRCVMCGTDSVNLVLFLRKPPSSMKTAGFPDENSRSRLAFPLAMGNFPETDILSRYISCDFCAFNLAKIGTTPDGDEIKCALPLVKYRINRPAYEKQLLQALESRFHIQDQILVFVAAAANAIAMSAPSDDTEQWRNAVLWLIRNLCEEVECSGFGKGSSTGAGSRLLGNSITDAMVGIGRTLSKDVLQYPLEGFVTAKLCFDTLEVTPSTYRGSVNAIWLRLLYHLTERYHECRSTRGRVLTDVAMAELLQHRKQATSPKPPPRRKTGRLSIRDLTLNALSDRSPKPLLTIDFKVLLDSPLFQPEDLRTFKKTKTDFDFIEQTTGYALATFLHYLARQKDGQGQADAVSHFATLRKTSTLDGIFANPQTIDAQSAKSAIRGLPSLVENAVAADDETP